MENKRIIQVDEKVPVKLLIPLSIQHMFAMFGASVLVPFVFGINPGIVLFMNGLGTLLFILITKGRAPAYLGSSFAFLAPAGIVISKWGYDYALGCFVAVGFCGCVLALIIYKFGSEWINVVLPPAAMGPVVALIGLELAGTAVSNAGLKDEVLLPANIIVFLVTLLTAVIGSVVFRGFLSVIPILIAIIAGYVASLACGIVDFSEVAAAPLFALPNFQTPKFNMQAIAIVLPVLLVITSEHIGHQIVTSKIVGRDLLKDPGLHRSLFADNFSTMLSGFIGSVPTTTYGENIGVMAMTKVYSVYVIGGAAVLSIICSFIGKMTTLISTIPGPVIGGISFLLYGMIGTSGIRLLVDGKVDYSRSRNLVLTSVVFVTGLSGIALKIGNVEMTGMVLACVVAMAMSLVFYILDKFGLDIQQKKGKCPGYYIGARDFELPELKLLVDAVQSSKFITEKKSKELIQKLEKLCCKTDAEMLSRYVFIVNRPKTENETVYYNVDYIHTAIYENKQIKFHYAEWTVKKELKFKKNGAFYVVSPWALTWDDENYYLVAYDATAGIIKHYRVDKMRDTEIIEADRKGEESFKNFDLAAFAKKTFGMYGGVDAEVTLECRNELAGVVIDRFGHGVWMCPHGEDHFRARVSVAVSSQFFGWITGIGFGMRIVGPEDVRQQYKEYLQSVIQNYMD